MPYIPPMLPLLYPLKTAARLLGVSRTTLYDMIRRKQIRAVRVGKVQRIPQRELAQFVLELRGLVVPEE